MGLENYACMYTLLRIQHICHIFLTDVKREETKKKVMHTLDAKSAEEHARNLQTAG